MTMTPSVLFDLSGKTALVTGGATGIGRMATTGLMAAGARVLIASRKGVGCVAVSNELNGLGLSGTAEGFGGDVGSEIGIAKLCQDIAQRTDKLDILINNAGRTWGAPLGHFPFEAWEKVMTLNVAGMFHLTQSLLPLLSAAATDEDPARVVNTCIVMGEVPMGDKVYSYAVSKAGVHHMTRILAKDLAARRITVNALAPGPFPSKMTAFAVEQQDGETRVASRVPLGRIGRPNDVAAALQFLCGHGGSYVTGAVIPLSGGINVGTGPEIFGDH